MHRFTRVVALLFLTSMLAACGGQLALGGEPTPPPASTRAPRPAKPTRTPRPAKATPEAATPAPESDQPAADSGALRDAIKQMRGIKAARMELALEMRGNAFESLGTGQSVTLALDGAFAGKNAEFSVSSSFFNSIPDLPSSLTMRVVDGKAYLRGPLPNVGGDENSWYSLDDYSSTGIPPVASLSSGNALIEELALQKLDLSGFTNAGTEQMDDQQCTVYRGDQVALWQAIDSLTKPGDQQPSAAAGEAVAFDRADLGLWVCADSYVHRFELDLAGKSKQEPVQNFAVKLRLDLSDFNGDIKIKAPENAQPLDTSSLVGGTSDPATSVASASVFNGGNIREQPVDGRVLGQLRAGQQVQLLEKTADGRWYRVSAPEATGWVSATLLKIDATTAARVPVQGAAAVAEPAVAEPAVATGLSATVANGGNLRDKPNRNGQVLDQINANENVQLLARNETNTWYRITNARGVNGWVNASLLRIDPAVAAQVPQE